jgi:predicted PurR-regulated permease PerM
LHQRIAKKFGRHPDLAAGASVFLVGLLIVFPVVLVGQRIAQDAQQAIAYVQSDDFKQKWQQFQQQHPRVNAAVEFVRKNGAGGLPTGIGSAASSAGSAVKGSAAGIVQLLIALFALFFFFRDRDQVLRLGKWLSPLSNEETERLFSRIKDTTYASIYGHVAVALIQGALGGLMFWFLGLPAPLLWGVVMGLLAIIPLLGAFVVWVPAAIYLALTGELLKAALLTGWGTLVVGTIDNVLYPRLVGKRLRLHTLPVFIAIVGGLSVFGAAGIVLGPLLLSLAMGLIEIWKMRTTHGQAAEEAA